MATKKKSTPKKETKKEEKVEEPIEEKVEEPIEEKVEEPKTELVTTAADIDTTSGEPKNKINIQKSIPVVVYKKGKWIRIN